MVQIQADVNKLPADEKKQIQADVNKLQINVNRLQADMYKLVSDDEPPSIDKILNTVRF